MIGKWHSGSPSGRTDIGRILLTQTLIGLITLCPILCGAEEFDHGAHRHAESEGHTQAPATPSHCPEEADNCICQGAVQAGDVRVPDENGGGLFLLLETPHLHHSPPIDPLTRDGVPIGLAGWGDALEVRSVLQNFRC